MFLKSSLLLTLCACVVLAAGCTKRHHRYSELQITPEISPQPPRVGQVVLLLHVTDLAGAAISGAQLSLEANMSHPGMAPVFADAAELEPGRYQAIMKLSMAGDWRFVIHTTLADHKEDYDFEIKEVKP